MDYGPQHDAVPTKTDGDPSYYDRLIPEREAADFLGYTVRALQNWRVRGGGPRFVKVSSRSIRYRRRDLIAWVDLKTVEHTSQPVEA
ncbi:MAG: helix-turn-helix domain-containing protein [Alphaproteobacteria bacterium]|nr:helix-turn-helix domain-containing protein [Alphaproteobacteria bacterium]